MKAMLRAVCGVVLFSIGLPGAGLRAAENPNAPKEKIVRQWKSAEGAALQAELMEFTGTDIKVKRYSDFQIVKIPLERLSAEDRKFVLDMVHKRDKDTSLKEGPYAAQVTGKFEKGTSKQGLLYQFFGNPKWDPAQRYALVINLHGSGSSGTDNEKQMGGATKTFTSTENQAEHPCFMLA